MNEATLKKNIADIIQLMFTRIVEVGGIETTIVDVPVIFADNINVYVGAPRPPYPFITIRILSIAQVGESEFSTIDDDGVMGIGAQKIATITVEYFGTNPNQNLAKIVIGLEKKNNFGAPYKCEFKFYKNDTNSEFNRSWL